MKILDWMHRRLHPVSSNYTRLAPRNASAFEEVAETVNKPQSPAEIELDIEASLLHHALLSIGTLGHLHSHLLPEEQQQQQQEESLKLVSPKTESLATEKPPVRITLLQPPVEKYMLETEQSGGDLDEEKLMSEVPLLMEDREKKQRTTLADLLSSESVSTGDEPPPAIAGEIKNAITVVVHISSDDSAYNSALKNCNNKEKMKVIKNNTTSSGSAAAKGIRRVISRMVKKKIHPLVETGEEAPGRNDGGGAAAVGLVNLLLRSHGDLPG